MVPIEAGCWGENGMGIKKNIYTKKNLTNNKGGVFKSVSISWNYLFLKTFSPEASHAKLPLTLIYFQSFTPCQGFSSQTKWGFFFPYRE